MNGKAPKHLEDPFRPNQTNTALVVRDSDNNLQYPFLKRNASSSVERHDRN